MKKWTITIIIIFLNLFILSSCNTKEIKGSELKGNQDYKVLLQATHPTPTDIAGGENEVTAEDIRKDIEHLDYIYDVAVVKGENEDLVVYKVKHFQRFRMKKIEKEVNEILEKKYPEENFVVSSDYKIFLEAYRLGKKMEDPNFSKKDAQKRLEEIIKLKKELT
jgi:preprotein translocase subunit SecF